MTVDLVEAGFALHDPTATPWVVVVVLFLLPVCIAVFLGVMAFRRMTPLVYRCRRCDRDFCRAAHRKFPTACPRCQARDWNSLRG